MKSKFSGIKDYTSVALTIPKVHQEYTETCHFPKSIKWFDAYQIVLIEPKQYRVMIGLLIFVSNFTFLDLASFCQFLLSDIDVKIVSFQTCFRQSAKGKMTAWEVQ